MLGGEQCSYIEGPRVWLSPSGHDGVGAQPCQSLGRLKPNAGRAPCDDGRLSSQVNVRIAELAPVHPHCARARSSEGSDQAVCACAYAYARACAVTVDHEH